MTGNLIPVHYADFDTAVNELARINAENFRAFGARQRVGGIACRALVSASTYAGGSLSAVHQRGCSL